MLVENNIELPMPELRGFSLFVLTIVLISHPSGNLSNFLMPLNKLLTLSTKRSGFIVSLPLEKFETREQKKQRHLPSESRKKILLGILSIEGSNSVK